MRQAAHDASFALEALDRLVVLGSHVGTGLGAQDDLDGDDIIRVGRPYRLVFSTVNLAHVALAQNAYDLEAVAQLLELHSLSRACVGAAP